jgi:hemerythrin-like metal-binding protein
MFLWNMSLETGIENIDQGRKRMLGAMADFFQGMDDPALTQHVLAARTGAIFNAMKAAFATEDAFLQTQGGESAERHQANHAALSAAFIDLCRKLVPKIKNQKQAQQCCLEIYQLVDDALFHHITKEVESYRVLGRIQVKKAG